MGLKQKIKMRKIKFRAWDKRGKKMYEVFNIDFIQKYVFLNKKKIGKVMMNFKSVELMQFTGLKDKNGKEIYEGDIIEYPKGVYYLDSKTKAKVLFSEEDACFKFLLEGRTIPSTFWFMGMEVIGNIYENEELLV